jgi:hypothetical protein
LRWIELEAIFRFQQSRESEQVEQNNQFLALINVRAQLLYAILISSLMLYDFSQNSSLSDWLVVDDVVMGGRSNGQFFIDDAGNGVFEGEISLENNGGFSSLRHPLKRKVGKYSTVKITLKGDGKNLTPPIGTPIYQSLKPPAIGKKY